MPVRVLDNQNKLTIDQETSRLNRLHEDWSKAIDNVRLLKGFEDFLRPHRLSSLQAAAYKFPVVTLVANDDGSHILIMTSANIHHIPLLTLSTQELQMLVHLVQAAASQSNILPSSIEKFSVGFPPAIKEAARNWMNLEEERGGRKYKDKISSDDIFRSVLKTLWNEVVKPVISFLNLKVSSQSVANYHIH